MSLERQNVYLRASRHLSWFRKGDEGNTEAKDAGALNSVINQFIK